MYVLSIKVPIRKKSGNLSYALRIYIFSDPFLRVDIKYIRFRHWSYNFVLLIIWSIILFLMFLHENDVEFDFQPDQVADLMSELSL